MTRQDLMQKISQKPFVLDGAMGTQIIIRKIMPTKCSDYLSIESPHELQQIHRSYLDAGCDAVITNTFGANKFALARHGLTEMVEDINIAAARIARDAAGENAYVLGDIGPTGDFLEPVGSLKPGELKDAFARQAEALIRGDIDAFIVETMADVEEAVIAVQAAKSVSQLPVWASLAFDSTKNGFKTMMGLDVSKGVSRLVEAGVDAVGFNCGKVPIQDYLELAQNYVNEIKRLDANIPLLAEPNAGLPELEERLPVYKVTPGEFAETALKIADLGFSIIGGCCGTGPEHIKALAEKIHSR